MKPTKYHLGNRALVRKKYEDAIALFEEHAVDCPGDAADAFSQAGLCMERWKHRQGWPDAERFYRRALKANPDYFPALDRLSQVLPERSSERLEILLRAASIQDNVLVLLSLGDYHRTVLRDFDSAYETYKRIQCIWPREKTAYLRLIDLCRRMGRMEESKCWSAEWQKNKGR